MVEQPANDQRADDAMRLEVWRLSAVDHGHSQDMLLQMCETAGAMAIAADFVDGHCIF